MHPNLGGIILVSSYVIILSSLLFVLVTHSRRHFEQHLDISFLTSATYSHFVPAFVGVAITVRHKPPKKVGKKNNTVRENEEKDLHAGFA